MDPMLLNEGETLLQIGKKVFKIPEGINFERDWQYDLRVCAQVKRIAARLGAYFHGFKEGKVIQECLDCGYSLLTPAGNEGYKLFHRDSRCNYPGCIDKIAVFYDNEIGTRKEDSAFMAKEDTCVLEEVFLATLMLQGHLKKYLLKGAEPRVFPRLRKVEKSKVLLTRCIQEYRKMARAFPKH